MAGFKGTKTGKFEELMVIGSEKDLKDFMRIYDVREEEIQKEW